MENGQVVPQSLYVYAPNRGAPIFFTITFATSAVCHIWQCFRYKCWGIIGLHPLCAVLFTAGYALREYGAYHYLYSSAHLILYIVSLVCIYICPPLLELANYHILGRIFYYVPSLAPLPAGRVLATFGGLMAIVEGLNAIGVALSTNPTGSQQGLGKTLTLLALGIQLCVILIFITMASIFHRRCARAKARGRHLFTLMTILYISMMLILVRCIYRLVDHSGNSTVKLDNAAELKSLSPLLRYEWYFYVFEATLMLINSVIWNIWNPGRFLPRDRNVHLAADGRTEIEGDKEPDQRPLIAKVGNVLTFGLLFRRKEGTVPNHRNVHQAASDRAEIDGYDEPDSRPLIVKAGSVLTLGLLFRKKKGERRPFTEMVNYRYSTATEAE